MPLITGSRLGPYEVVSVIGAGGMGEVYRARDTRLGRDVAIKVLPSAFAADPERLARFEQEARAAAALNHPNILAVHDLGQHDGAPFIVTELLDGMSLREALSGGALPARKAIDYGVAVALGLAAAHDKGIVHRDIKPDNVFITADGRVKILDFGVAKLTQPDAALSGMTVLPTTPGGVPHTMSGMVVGTIGYMSPEQVRGGVADPRSDIFSLGVLLHEMLSGQRTFSGDTAADVMSGILRQDAPELPVAERHIPPALARIVNRCLEKSPGGRFQSARDLAFALEALTAPTSSSGSSVVSGEAVSPRRRVVSLPVAGIAALLVAVLAAGAAWMVKPAVSSDATVTRLSIALPDGDRIFSAETPSLDISPDGKHVAYAAVHEGVPTLMVRARDSVTSQALPGTDGAVSPFFSPDGKSIGFFARGRLRTISIESSETKDLADAPNARGGWWAEDGFIYYAAGSAEGISKLPSGGGTPSAVTTLDRSKGEISHRWPQVLPGGKGMLISVWTGPARDNRFVQVLRFDNGHRETVATGDSGRYSPSGHVLFSRLDALMAVPFDVDRLAAAGPVVKTADTARIGSEGASFAVSNRGDLVNLPGDPHRMDARLVWVDRSGHVEPLQVPAQDMANATLSPDGLRAAFNVHGATDEIGIVEFGRGVVTMLTTNTNGSQVPVWSPDGRRIAYRGTRKGFRNVWVKSVDGTSEEQQLTRGESVQTPLSWSPDGKNLLYYDATTTSTGWDLSMVSVADGKAQSLFTAAQNQFGAQWSPDGRWIAYDSNESGRDEVYVLPFPLTGHRWRVSTDGGAEPVWSHDGRELVYRGGNKLWAVDVRTSPAFTIGTPQALFPDTFVSSPNGSTGYSISNDGKRFLFAQPVQPDPPITHVQVVLNWFAELRRATAGSK
jgi:serine/threonine protein kinase/dipeptidyl aminopeptidase/acylaminoacyl peptidase